MGGQSQSRSSCCSTQQQDHDRGSSAPLSTHRGRVPLVAARLREPWCPGFESNLHPAVSRIATTRETAKNDRSSIRTIQISQTVPLTITTADIASNGEKRTE